jgi:hypothetical protein
MTQPTEIRDGEYAVITHADGTVERVLVADVPLAPEPMPNRHLTKRAFWNRFPAAKEAVIRAVRLGAPAGYLMLVGALDRLNSRVDASPYVNLDDPQTVDGINWLASDQAPDYVALDGQRYPLRLTADEAAAILIPDPVGAEAYTG